MKNKETVLFRWSSSFIIFTLLIILSACFSPYKGGNKGTITINIGGNSKNSSRSAVPWPPNDPDNFILDKIDYIITLTGNGQSIHLEANGVDTIIATVSVGWWNVNVKAYYPEKDTLYAEGNGDVDVKANQYNTVSVQMIKAFDDTYTVTFDSMGGSVVSQITGVVSGELISEPANPTTTGYDSKFLGWLQDGSVFDFSTPITGDITLTADWGHYTIGETGPGGGIIFNVDPSGFPLQGQTPGYTAHYLEAAPSSALSFTDDGMRLFEPFPIFPPLNTVPLLILESDIGTGKRNTERLIAWAVTNENDITSSPAANYCVNFSIYGYENVNDWFLPSIDELSLIYDNLHETDVHTYPVLTQGTIHSSSWDYNAPEYYSAGIIFVAMYPPHGAHTPINFNDKSWVIPIRAF